jgi:hypothetical protein
MLHQLPRTQVSVDVFALQGGLDLHTPQLSLKPGHARGSTVNYECSINGGYSRLFGYERYDGRPSPSAAGYVALATNLTSTPAVGVTLNGQTSGATGVVAAVDGTTVVLTKSTGTFADGENLRNGTTVLGTIVSTSNVTISDTQAAQYALAAANIYRADIGAVPGSGSVLGVFEYGGVTYAWRNNAGGTAAALYKATTGGWVAVTLFYELAFSSGSGTAPSEGSTITKGAVSAVVKRVVLESGSWSGSNAAGRLIIAAPTGGSFSSGAFTAGITATCGGAESAISFQPGGKFEFHIGDAGNGKRVYGCDAVNRGWEFDGTVLVPIKTGMATDAPSHVRVHKKHLFFSFDYSVQHSGLGLAYQWSPIVGAAEISAGDTVTGFLGLPGSQTSGALAIFTIGGAKVLYGNSSADWTQLPVEVDDGAGCYARTQAYVGQALVFNDRGIVSLSATQNYGNFDSAALTFNLRSFVQARRNLVTCSLLNREKSQYRVFFSDGYGLFATIVNGKFIGAMPVQFPNPVVCAWLASASSGVESSYFGSTNGMVYRLDTGTSFDGAEIAHTLELSYVNQRSPRVRKRYRACSLELQGDGYSEFQFGYSLSYGSEDVDQPVSVTASSATKPAYWDSFTWDNFTWDGRAIAPSEIGMDGTGENVSLVISGSSALWPSFTVNSATLHYSPRRLTRGG